MTKLPTTEQAAMGRAGSLDVRQTNAKTRNGAAWEIIIHEVIRHRDQPARTLADLASLLTQVTGNFWSPTKVDRLLEARGVSRFVKGEKTGRAKALHERVSRPLPYKRDKSRDLNKIDLRRWRIKLQKSSRLYSKNGRWLSALFHEPRRADAIRLRYGHPAKFKRHGQFIEFTGRACCTVMLIDDEKLVTVPFNEVPINAVEVFGRHQAL